MSNYNMKLRKPNHIKSASMAPGTEERELLKKELERQSNEIIEIPAIVNGKEVYTDDKYEIRAPHKHSLKLAVVNRVGKEQLQEAIEASMAAKEKWEKLPAPLRLGIFQKATELIEGKYRYVITAATMLGQSKTPWEAECDSPSELCDLIRFEIYHCNQIYNYQPDSTNNAFNRLVYRPLEGFVAAISPFNFTALNGNLPVSPAIAGNTVVWKPASTAPLSSYYVMKALMEAGLPDGVINFVPSRGSDVNDVVLTDRRLGGIHFTGSTQAFNNMWQTVGENIHNYISYPRLVGETGGKNFNFSTKNANIDGLVAYLIRGAYELQGQKCSATSRAYIPAEIWPEVKEKLISEVKTIKYGDITDFTNFMGAVIDESSFKNIKGYLDRAKESDEIKVIAGGGYDDSEGWFVEPTILQTNNMNYETMMDEIFGPVLTVYVYEEDEYDAAVDHAAHSSAYGLTGAIWTDDRYEIAELEEKFRHSAGSLYINDKASGALTNEQPFGGARGSGTNDKSGSIFNVNRWMSVQTVKDHFTPVDNYRFPYMEEK